MCDVFSRRRSTASSGASSILSCAAETSKSGSRCASRDRDRLLRRPTKQLEAENSLAAPQEAYLACTELRSNRQHGDARSVYGR